MNLFFNFHLECNSCITDHPSFDVVCLHKDVLRTALVCMHDVRSDSLKEPIDNC